VTRLQDARLVVQNGLGLDDWVADLVTDAGTDAPIVVLAEDLEGVDYREAGAHEEEEGHADEEHDPHVWLNVGYARLYAARIADELTAVDPDGAATYAANLEAYDAELAELDRYARETLGAIPESRRMVVSFHEAFGYFADRYRFEVLVAIIPGGSTLAEPSAAELADLVTVIKEQDVPAVFAEASSPARLADALAAEGADVDVVELYSESLGEPGSPGDSYLGMVRTNAERIAAALG
jgi:ABC-type Zn uptake system ZnuABC Zn-binding protein ZnuA